MTEIVATSAGRINIIGEHTDYNDGFVLPAAIDKKTTVRISRNSSNSNCNIVADNFNESLSFHLKDMNPLPPGWQNYVLGVVSELQKLGANFSGFDARFHGDVPIGSGMSSSASLECSFVIAINELFDLKFDKWQLIKAAQMAEHNYVGMKCGIMDQFASIMGKKDHVMLLDCRSLEFKYFPLELGDYQLLLFNTNVSHALADSDYNERREQCDDGVGAIRKAFPQVKNLRDVSMHMLDACSADISQIIYNRCKHVIHENQRVLDACDAMGNGQIGRLGGLMYASHDSLTNDYEVSCKELDFLVDCTKSKPYVVGSRMMGGGFGGCTINIVEKNKTAQLIEELADLYKSELGLELGPYEVAISDGAQILKDLS